MNYQVKGISGHQWVCVGCVRVAQVCAGVLGLAWVWAVVHGYALVCTFVLDEFSEFLQENRVPTSADFNTYPIRIFYLLFLVSC